MLCIKSATHFTSYFVSRADMFKSIMITFYNLCCLSKASVVYTLYKFTAFLKKAGHKTQPQN